MAGVSVQNGCNKEAACKTHSAQAGQHPAGAQHDHAAAVVHEAGVPILSRPGKVGGQAEQVRQGAPGCRRTTASASSRISES